MSNPLREALEYVNEMDTAETIGRGVGDRVRAALALPPVAECDECEAMQLRVNIAEGALEMQQAIDADDARASQAPMGSDPVAWRAFSGQWRYADSREDAERRLAGDPQPLYSTPQGGLREALESAGAWIAAVEIRPGGMPGVGDTQSGVLSQITAALTPQESPDAN